MCFLGRRQQLTAWKQPCDRRAWTRVQTRGALALWEKGEEDK